MESSIAEKQEKVGPVEVEDIRRNLLREFDALPTQSQTENLQVYLRVRPFTAAESDNGKSQDCVTIEGPDTVILRPPKSSQSNRQSDKSLPQTAQRFTFTQVFSPEASQRKVFEGSVRSLVQDVLQGGNCLVFTYGVTNAGKTFTFLGPDHDSGLLPRSLSIIFNSIEGNLYSCCDLKPQRCRDFSRLTPDQQAAEAISKRNLFRLFKESEKILPAGRSTFLEGSSLSSDSSVNSVSEADSFCLDVKSNVRFSVWVSFCEIYNENIHDLLEQVPGGQQKRTVLRLSQDVKGNSFIRDLRWVQVNSSEEAYRVMKTGKKNQSCFSTKLNQLSSRSHSIFSIRILRIDATGVPRVLGISELALCDLAGSERCSRTHNTGDRLKEAGNINTSLLTLGKCINAMRLNQNAKFQHHVPFRESKLTHFLQFFFCGAGRVAMVVNINQHSYCFDETLNVLKFSALAQKVVLLNSQPTVLNEEEGPLKSAMELSIVMDKSDQLRNVLGRGRKSSLIAWETSLEDVKEAEDDEEEEEEEEESLMEGTVLENGGDEEAEDQTMEEEEGSDREAALRLVLEAQIREEVSAEFMELFKKMEKDYSERLEKEREILEKRADRRVEILKNLVDKTVDLPAFNTDDGQEKTALEGILSSLSKDLLQIREDAQSVQNCLAEQTHTADLEMLRLEKLQLQDQLQEASRTLEQQQHMLSEFANSCQQKDEVISKLQEAVERATRDSASFGSCGSRTSGEEERRKRKRDDAEEEEEGGAAKRMVLEEEIWRLHEENDKKEETISELRRELEEKQGRWEEEVEELKKENSSLDEKVQILTDLDECVTCNSVLSSLEMEQKETARLQKENKALVNGIFLLQTEVAALQTELKQQTNKSDSLSEQFDSAKSRLQNLENQLEEKTDSIKRLTEEVDCLRQEVKEEEGRSRSNSSAFHTAMEELKKESKAALQRSAQKSEQIEELQREKQHLEEMLEHSKNRCQELSNQTTELTHHLQNLRVEYESEGGALRQRLEEMGRAEERRQEQEKEVSELRLLISERETLLEDSQQLTETLRQELQHLKENLQRSEEEGEEEEEKENLGVKEKRDKRLCRMGDDREAHLQGELQDVCASPLRSGGTGRKKISRTLGRKRKNSEEQEGGAPLKIKELIQNSPFLRTKAKPVPAPVSDHSVEKEAVTVVTKPRRGRRKLFKLDTSSQLVDSPHMVRHSGSSWGCLGELCLTVYSISFQMSAGAEDDKESDHLIIRRQLRSKTCKK
ncbi:transcript variant X3 [Nothobranchius furzeri]|uniref:Transcript variant X3 n=1 Tax=Nothobranchius furzeri TaxID=105023 RepID=A0A9D3BDX2_NOTFU|nr:transcript variant X3 [Nothobranchius furzeri]